MKMNLPAFLDRAGALFHTSSQTYGKISAPSQPRKRVIGGSPVMKSSAAVSRRSKIGQLLKHPEAQGPHCPFVDQNMVLHCLLCAKELNKTKLEKEESVKELLSKARRSLLDSQRGEAEHLFLRALVLDPTNSKTYFLYALQAQRRDPLLARTLFRQGLRETPGDAKILQAWGLFESKQGKLERAQRLLKRSIELEPRNASVLKWKVLFPAQVADQ